MINLEHQDAEIMPTRNVNLTDHFDHFIEVGITSGRFSNASEVVREALRLLEQRDKEDHAKLAWLRASAKQATDSIDRGEGFAFDSIEDLEAYVRQIGEGVSAGLMVDRTRG